MTQGARFNPNEHMMKLKSKDGMKDYLPVQWRLVWFREQCPDGTIETELVHLDLDKEMEEEAFVWNNDKRKSERVIKSGRGVAIFRAVVKDGKGGVATGTKMEKAVSFADFIEKSETGAIGRALAALGYGTQFTGDEFDERERIVDAPVESEHHQNTRKEPELDLAEVSLRVGKAFDFKQDTFEARWSAYKQHVLNSAKSDDLLTQSDIKKLLDYAIQHEKKTAAVAKAS